MILRGHINSVPWMNAATPTPVPWMQAVCRPRQVTFLQFIQRILWANYVHSWYGVGVTAFIHGMELMRFGKVTLWSTINIQQLWSVKVTLKVIKGRSKVFCWYFLSLQIASTDQMSLLLPPPPPHQTVGQCLNDSESMFLNEVCTMQCSNVYFFKIMKMSVKVQLRVPRGCSTGICCVQMSRYSSDSCSDRLVQRQYRLVLSS